MPLARPSARRYAATRPLLSACLLLLPVAAGVSGCHRRSSYVPPEGPLPPNTILLSGMMRDLSAQPGFTEGMLAAVEGGKPAKGAKKGPALLTPALVDDLRARILGKDWASLDRFPGWSMHEINPTVRVVGHEVGKSRELEDTAAVHPGSAPSATRQYLDLGPYALDKSATITLDQPSTFLPFDPRGIVSDLGHGVTRGDGPNGLAGEHAESERLADLLNRLSANPLDGVAPLAVQFGGETVTSPEALIGAIAAKETVTVDDARYFANFGHLHYSPPGAGTQAEDVMMPFWVNTGILIPHTDGIFTRGRPLLIPVSHAEYEWHIRASQGGRGFNADISYYFGIDGKSEWRTMDTLDQAWVGKRNAHEYTGAQAVEVTRLAARLSVAYMHLHTRRARLPFGGYYALGVCQDGVSAIERRMTGKVTLYPNTADSALFDDPRDAEVNSMIAAIPKDRTGVAPGPERIFGSLPAEPGPGGDWSTITIPGFATDLRASYFAWQNGSLKTVRTPVNKPLIAVLLLFVVVMSISIIRHHNRRESHGTPD